MRVLYFCEGFTDIRFVVGLSERCELTMVTPEWEFQSSGLAERIDQSGARLTVDKISGRRAAFQLKSCIYLLRHIRKFDVVLSQGMVRGSLNAALVGTLLSVPVVTYLAIAPVAYWRCRRERGQMGALVTIAGEAFIRFCLNVSGRLATTALAMGPFLTEFVGRYSSHPATGYYYGVDVSVFKPIDGEGRLALRCRHDLPRDRFLILFSSRISHEKDPETALRATAIARARGLDAMLLNLGGGFQDFLKLARDLGLQDAEEWVIGRPAVHPMKELCQYFQAVDLVVQASLSEGSGMSPLEALACGTPVVATNVDGLAVQLKGIAQLTPRRDADAMADAILWVARNRQQAAEQAMKGYEYVHSVWRRDKAFDDLMRVLEEAVSRAGWRGQASERRGAGRRAPRLKETP
jgi:glycosyltransferase involved in cell wall biosynthesis